MERHLHLVGEHFELVESSMLSVGMRGPTFARAYIPPTRVSFRQSMNIVILSTASFIRTTTLTTYIYVFKRYNNKLIHVLCSIFPQFFLCSPAQCIASWHCVCIMMMMITMCCLYTVTFAIRSCYNPLFEKWPWRQHADESSHNSTREMTHRL